MLIVCWDMLLGLARLWLTGWENAASGSTALTVSRRLDILKVKGRTPTLRPRQQMESANALNIANVAALAGLILAVMAFSGGVLYRLGVLSNRVGSCMAK